MKDEERVPLRTVLQNFLNYQENLEKRRSEGDDWYEKEFQELKQFSESLKRNPQYSCEEGEREVNRKKNRYKDILPFDYTRVSLSDYGSVPGSDYINANYIKGASGSAAYIACQGPLPHTLNDFWRMVIECEVQVIVMACNEQESGKHKCENYWVESEDEEKLFGKVTVRLIKARRVCPDFLIRTMHVTYITDHGKTESRTVCQFHYSAWPDHGVPSLVRPLLDMVRLVRDCQASETLPVLVHCSAGCGRTGTICAIDYVWGLLRRGKLSEGFTMYSLVREMRRQRVAMVQTKEQYVLVHRAVRELFQEQLKLINAHPYANVDSHGRPLIDDEKVDPLYESLDSLHDGEKIDDKEKEGSEDSLSDSDVRIHQEDVAPPLPIKKQKGTVASKLEKEVENLHQRHRAFHSSETSPSEQLVETPPKTSASPLESSTESIDHVSSNSGSLSKKRRLFHFSSDKDDVLHSKSHSEPNSSRASPIRSALLRKPSIVKLKTFFERGVTASSSTRSKEDDPAASHKTPQEPIALSKPQSEPSSVKPASSAKKSSNSSGARSLFQVKRSKSMKMQWSGKHFQVVPSSDIPQQHQGEKLLPHLSLEAPREPRSNHTPQRSNKPNVPPRRILQDQSIRPHTRQKSMQCREAIQVTFEKSKPVEVSPYAVSVVPQPRVHREHLYANVQSIKKPDVKPVATTKSSQVTPPQSLQRSRSYTWQNSPVGKNSGLQLHWPERNEAVHSQLQHQAKAISTGSVRDEVDSSVLRIPQPSIHRSKSVHLYERTQQPHLSTPPSTAPTSETKSKLALSGLYAKVLPRSKRKAAATATTAATSTSEKETKQKPGSRPHSAYLGDDAQQLLRNCREYLDQGDASAEAHKRMCEKALQSLGVRERRDSFRQAVSGKVPAKSRPHDYEPIWLEESNMLNSNADPRIVKPPQVMDKACQTSDLNLASTKNAQALKKSTPSKSSSKTTPVSRAVRDPIFRQKADEVRHLLDELNVTPPRSKNPMSLESATYPPSSTKAPPLRALHSTSSLTIPPKLPKPPSYHPPPDPKPYSHYEVIVAKDRPAAEKTKLTVITPPRFSSHDDLDLRPQAPPRIKRNSSLAAMSARHSMIEQGEMAQLSVWADQKDESPPGVDLDRVAIKLKQQSQSNDVSVPINSPSTSGAKSAAPTSPKPLLRALGKFRSKIHAWKGNKDDADYSSGSEEKTSDGTLEQPKSPLSRGQSVQLGPRNKKQQYV